MAAMTLEILFLSRQWKAEDKIYKLKVHDLVDLENMISNVIALMKMSYNEYGK